MRATPSPSTHQFSSGAGSALRAAARMIGEVLTQDCALCARPGAHRMVCCHCASGLPRATARCPVCALPVPERTVCARCLRRPPPYDATVAVFDYDYPVDQLIHALKYRSRLALAPFFADALAAALERETPAVDLVIPVPLASRRLRERGFNQALEVAKRLGRLRGLTVHPRALSRCRETESQAALATAQRKRNVRGAFHVAAEVSGVRIAIVDDVMTTGATLSEIARTLKARGAASVHNWVLARATA